MLNLNLTQLEVFVAVVEQGSFTKAAESLFMAQSTVSNHIQSLEKKLNTLLFTRKSKKNVTLTPDGKRCYQHAKTIISKCAALVGDIAKNVDNELIIGASTLPSQSIVPDLVAGFIEKYPNCTCVIKNGNSDQIQQMLSDGEVHIGFVGSSDNHSNLAYDIITDDHLVLITANTPEYAALKAAGIYGKELLDRPMVFREHGSGTQRVTDFYLSSINVDPQKLHIVARVSSPSILKNMVARDVGVSILSDLTVTAQIKSGELLQFEMDKQPVTRNIYIAHRKKGALSDLAKRFMSYALENKTENKEN